MKSFRFIHLLIIVAIGVVLNSTCRKDDIITDTSAKLKFSTDSIAFDTVFTTIGSITKQLKVYNPHKSPIKITSIRLLGGTASNFRININGKPAVSATNIEIDAEDSMYIFIAVTVDPNNSTAPAIITDQIQFITNGNKQDVDLTAYGWDAYYHTPTDTLLIGTSGILFSYAHCNDIWPNDKPHVIYGITVVDSDSTLTIGEGTNVYLYTNGIIWVYEGGSLKVYGSKSLPVTFQGSRLEQDYREYPGQWGKIWLSALSVDNEINYAIIKNGTIGIQADTVGNANPTLKLDNTIIRNMSAAGIYGQGSVIRATNCVVSSCGQYGIVLSLGGDYDFRHCTVGNYWDFTTRQTPSVVLNNYYEDINHNIQPRNLTNAYFGNCIIYGNIESEIAFDMHPSAAFNYSFDHCLLKTDTNTAFFLNCIRNQNPKFEDYPKNDYRLDTLSPAINKGSATITGSIINDLKGDIRIQGSAPDLGAYERNQ